MNNPDYGVEKPKSGFSLSRPGVGSGVGGSAASTLCMVNAPRRMDGLSGQPKTSGTSSTPGSCPCPKTPAVVELSPSVGGVGGIPRARPGGGRVGGVPRKAKLLNALWLLGLDGTTAAGVHGGKWGVEFGMSGLVGDASLKSNRIPVGQPSSVLGEWGDDWDSGSKRMYC